MLLTFERIFQLFEPGGRGVVRLLDQREIVLVVINGSLKVLVVSIVYKRQVVVRVGIVGLQSHYPFEQPLSRLWLIGIQRQNAGQIQRWNAVWVQFAGPCQRLIP